MDTRDIEQIKAGLERFKALQRLKPQPQPSAFAGWGPWIAAVILFAFMAWLIGVGVVQITLDAVNGITGQ